MKNNGKKFRKMRHTNLSEQNGMQSRRWANRWTSMSTRKREQKNERKKHTTNEMFDFEDKKNCYWHGIDKSGESKSQRLNWNKKTQNRTIEFQSQEQQHNQPSNEGMKQNDKTRRMNAIRLWTREPRQLIEFMFRYYSIVSKLFCISDIWLWDISLSFSDWLLMMLLVPADGICISYRIIVGVNLI